jgi:hypothetical protein
LDALTRLVAQVFGPLPLLDGQNGLNLVSRLLRNLAHPLRALFPGQRGVIPQHLHLAALIFEIRPNRALLLFREAQPLSQAFGGPVGGKARPRSWTLRPNSLAPNHNRRNH